MQKDFDAKCTLFGKEQDVRNHDILARVSLLRVDVANLVRAACEQWCEMAFLTCHQPF